MDEQGKLTKVGDGYRNVVANLGTDRDKATGGSYVTTLHNAAELLTMYRSSWLARKIVDIPAFDSIRRWRSWNAEKDDITKIENEERRLGLQKKVQSALTLARLYGGAAIFISTKETDVSKPLSAKEEISHLTVIPRQMLVGDLTQTDISSSRFGLPIFYTVNSTGISMDTGGQQKIHHSRLVKFAGAEIPWGDTQIHEDWGDSVLTAMMDAIHRADSTAANIASLVFEAKVDVIHVPKLMQLISTPEGEVAVKEYIRLAMQTKSINGALILDGGDTTKSENESGGTRYDAKSASFAGLDSVFDRFLQAVSGAADIPATRLLGQAPAGMNATGESDLRNYYDHVQSIQTIELGPEMAMLDEMLVRQATGKGIGEIWYDWRALWQPTDEQKLAAGKQVAGIVGDMAKLRLWPDEVLSKAGANAMIETGALPGLEAAINEWTEEEGDLFVEPEAGEGEPDVNRAPGGNVVTLEGRQKRANVQDHNPYHDEKGRFTTGPGKALSEFKSVDFWGNPDPDSMWVAPPSNMRALPEDSEVTSRMLSDVRQNGGWDAAPRESFVPDLDSLVATQPVLKKAMVEELVRSYDPSKESNLQPGAVYRTPSGANVVLDGHHRLIVAALTGREVSPRVFRGTVELDNIQKRADVKDYNPNHYPAGTPGGKGGEFAPEGTGSGGSGLLSMDQKARELVDARETAKNHVHSEKYFAEGIDQEQAYYKAQGELVERLTASSKFPSTKNVDSVIRPKAEVTPEVRSELRGKGNFGYDYKESRTASFDPAKSPGPVDRAIHMFEAKKPFTTYRGVEGGFASKILEMRPGDEYQEGVSASTSYSASMASNYAGIENKPGVVIAIRVRKGDAVAPTVKYSESKSEKELTLPAGTKYRVTGVDKDARTAVVEIIGQPKIENGRFVVDTD